MNWMRLCIFLIFFIVCPLTAHSDTQLNKLTEIKANALRLRNTDVQLKKVSEWQSLAKQLTVWAQVNSKKSEAADALYTAGIMWRILFQGLGTKDFATQATDVWQALVKKFPQHKHAPETLLKLGELYLFDLEDKESAEVFFEQLILDYPRSNLVNLAKERLKNGQSKGSRNKDSLKYISERNSPALIVIDPGHGGEDLGAVNAGGLLEKDVVLAVSFELEKLLRSRLGASVILTRRSDVFVPLAVRTQIANDQKADLFISLHVNASASGKASGLEVYYLDNTDDQASKKLAERENASMNFEDQPDDLQFILSDLIQNAKLDESIKLAKVMDRQIYSYLKPRWPGIRSLGVKKAPFYVLVGAHMPCVLVELFFINHPADAANLIQRDFRRDMAEAVYNGVERYLVDIGKVN